MTVRDPANLLDRWEGRSAHAWADRLGVATAEFHARIGSTSDRARVLGEEGRPLPAVVLADRQTTGRGRQGRRWASDSVRGLWFTVARAGPGDARAPLPLRIGLAVARALDAVAPEVGTEVKWPNDIMVEGRKLGGILCEHTGRALLVGIGINVNQRLRELPSGLTPPATSLLIESGRPASRAQILERLADELQAVWSRPAGEIAAGEIAAGGIPADELEALNARSALRGRRLSVSGVVRHSSEPPRRVEAFSAAGDVLLADGSLTVRDDSGARLRLIAGSVEILE